MATKTSLLLLPMLIPGAAFMAAQTASIFHANVNLVEVSFVITDNAGKYVGNLNADDLRITEDGREQQIRRFLGPADQNGDDRGAASIFVLFDTSNSIYTSFPQTEDSIAAFIR